MVRQPRFRTRRKSWRRFLPFVSLAGLLIAAWWVSRMPSIGGSWQDWSAADGGKFTICGEGSSPACVIDGDTIVIGYPPKARKIRMSDYNAPELKGECAAEIELAKEARTTLQTWLNQGEFSMSGGDDPPYDQYGRELRAFMRRDAEGNDHWLADAMVDSGTARSEWWDQGGGWCG